MRFLPGDAPYYKQGYSICLAFLCLSAASCCVYAVAVIYQNRKRDRSPTDVGLTEYEKTEMGVSFVFFCLVFESEADKTNRT